MSVIITDMEMPKDCDSCDMTYEDRQLHDICKFCHKDVSYIQADDKDVDCPLKSVDGLIEKLKETWGRSFLEFGEVADIIKEYCEEKA